MNGIDCPACHVGSDLLSTTTEWQYYCHNCQRRFSHDGRFLDTTPALCPVHALPDAFSHDFFTRGDHKYSGSQILDWLKRKCTDACPSEREAQRLREVSVLCAHMLDMMGYHVAAIAVSDLFQLEKT